MILDRWRPTNHLIRKLKKGTGMKVWSGPFQGMRYVDAAVGSSYHPKLLGCYEKELHPIIEELARVPFDVGVDIGAAEGYYAVGMAYALKIPRVIAYEMTDKGRELIEQMADLNGVGPQIEIHGHAGPGELQEALRGASKPFVLCDAEGDEEVILDPEKVPALGIAHMLVEVHEVVTRNLGDILIKRFAATHDAVEIQAVPRDGDEYPFRDLYIQIIPKSFRQSLTREGKRRHNKWLYFVPRSFL